MNHNKPTKLEKYIKEKIKMLENEFCMKLSSDEKAHFYNLKDELLVDQYAHDLFLKEDWDGKGNYREYEKRYFI